MSNAFGAIHYSAARAHVTALPPPCVQAGHSVDGRLPTAACPAWIDGCGREARQRTVLGQCRSDLRMLCSPPFRSAHVPSFVLKRVRVHSKQYEGYEEDPRGPVPIFFTLVSKVTVLRPLSAVWLSARGHMMVGSYRGSVCNCSGHWGRRRRRWRSRRRRRRRRRRQRAPC